MDVKQIVAGKIPSEKLPTETLLDVYIEEVKQAILTYCNRSDIPDELKFTHANMVVDLVLEEERKLVPDGNKDIKTIKEGDVQVSYENRSSSFSETSTQQILFNYTSQLNRHRKLRR